MLYYSHQIWISDNTDALSRIKIQYGSSLIYPSRCIASHISASPNHITGDSTRLRTRSLVAMCGTYGFELSLTDLSGMKLNIYIIIYDDDLSNNYR